MTMTKAFYDASVKRLTLDEVQVTAQGALYDPRMIEELQRGEDLLGEIGEYIAKLNARMFAAGYNAAIEDVRANRYDTDDRFWKLREAVRNVYYGAFWTQQGPATGRNQELPEDEAVRLWTELRDAAGFEPGNAPLRGME
jgi:hypothetical protein